jgi:hypothetical protein
MDKKVKIIIITISILLLVVLFCCASTFVLTAWVFNQDDSFGYVDEYDTSFEDIEIPEGMKVRDVSDFNLNPEIFEANDFVTQRPKDLGQWDFSPIFKEYNDTEYLDLLKYFSSNPRWFVTEEFGHIYAYRRLPVDGGLQSNLNGFYNGFDVDSLGSIEGRVVVSFGDPIFTDKFDSQYYKVGEQEIKTKHNRNSSRYESYFVIESEEENNITIEISESSEDNGRVFTTWAIGDILDEFRRAKYFNSNFSISEYENELEITSGLQGGIYNLFGFVNPGQAGYVYIKAFEATQDIPLSSNDLETQTREYVGFSGNNNEKFLYNSYFIISEGSWGNYYPARFELWFVPLDDEPERKIAEDIFLIEGWQR